MANDQKLKKGYAAPLEGDGSIRFLLELAFLGIGLRMLAGLSNTLDTKPGSAPQSNALKLNAPTITSGFIAPRPPTLH
ncbi:MAG: hypothetical protein KGL10_09740 [Alphaproteobacteria bacterium]|nr:hypothetical protein [Alphaproteobacteria bacterium]MDE2337580.1 hypothetical protein [Alphaproteobacteria bacterium]